MPDTSLGDSHGLVSTVLPVQLCPPGAGEWGLGISMTHGIWSCSSRECTGLLGATCPHLVDPRAGSELP